MKKIKVGLLFKYDIDGYKAGSCHELELTQVAIDRLTRRGCIYAPKDAKYYKEEKKVVVKPAVQKVEKPVIETPKPVSEDVTSKDIEQRQEPKVQTRSTYKK